VIGPPPDLPGLAPGGRASPRAWGKFKRHFWGRSLRYQHQFEHTYWAWDADWNVHTGALHGSSHYDLPPVLRWFTANIGIHHVHHLCSRIPCYRLGEVLREYPELRAVSRLTLKDSFRCLRLALWDEDKRRLVGFREARASLISGFNHDQVRASSPASLEVTDCR
jgi:fatty acid desaturase